MVEAWRAGRQREGALEGCTVYQEAVGRKRALAWPPDPALGVTGEPLAGLRNTRCQQARGEGRLWGLVEFPVPVDNRSPWEVRSCWMRVRSSERTVRKTGFGVGI